MAEPDAITSFKLGVELLKGGYPQKALPELRRCVELQSQAAILSFLDCFWLLGAFALIGPVLASFIRKFNQNAGAGAAH